MNQFSNNDYPEYPVFKGLQRPLEFMGLRGRYIYWAVKDVDDLKRLKSSMLCVKFNNYIEFV